MLRCSRPDGVIQIWLGVTRPASQGLHSIRPGFWRRPPPRLGQNRVPRLFARGRFPKLAFWEMRSAGRYVPVVGCQVGPPAPRVFLRSIGCCSRKSFKECDTSRIRVRSRSGDRDASCDPARPLPKAKYPMCAAKTQLPFIGRDYVRNVDGRPRIGGKRTRPKRFLSAMGKSEVLRCLSRSSVTIARRWTRAATVSPRRTYEICMSSVPIEAPPDARPDRHACWKTSYRPPHFLDVCRSIRRRSKSDVDGAFNRQMGRRYARR